MSYPKFQAIFYGILSQTPLPNGDKWNLKPLQNADLRNEHDWIEVLYRTRATYQCNHGHSWNSSWTIVLFQFHLDAERGYGKVRMKRFRQRCSKCREDDTYHLGFCSKKQVWYMVQCLLLNILQRCYERRPESDVDDAYYIIPVSDVPRGRFGGLLHQRPCCEACAHDRCQEKYKQLTKKK